MKPEEESSPFQEVVDYLWTRSMRNMAEGVGSCMQYNPDQVSLDDLDHPTAEEKRPDDDTPFTK